MSLLAATASSQNIASQATPAAPATRTTVKDSGRVHVGGQMIRFASVRDAGRVHVGGQMIRFASVRDAGRVRVGGQMIRF